MMRTFYNIKGSDEMTKLWKVTEYIQQNEKTTEGGLQHNINKLITINTVSNLKPRHH